MPSIEQRRSPSPPLSDSPVSMLDPRAESALPTLFQDWPLASSVLRIGTDLDPDEVSLEQVRGYARDKAWRWPSRLLLFFCDIHADTDAFLLSLVASGGVERTGPSDSDFQLTA